MKTTHPTLNFGLRFLTLLFVVTLASCSLVLKQDPSEGLLPQAGFRVHWQPGRCESVPVAVLPAQTLPLDSERIVILNWNIAKGSRPGWQADLRRLAEGKDLVLLQEALLDRVFPRVLALDHHDFAPGYRTLNYVSGVMTTARSAPVSHCSLKATEPLLASPKMALITEYPLSNSDQTLLVANIHVVNFSLGLAEMRRQLRQVVEILGGHKGPVIFSGDFNTWWHSRTQLVQELVAELNLEPVLFPEDNRRRAFGYPLDHLFYRGLKLESAQSLKVNSSDHNPIIAILNL